MYMSVRVCVCARTCVHARECVHDVFAISDNNISPRLIVILIIIKIIIPCFIQIRHTDDFPSTGPRLVQLKVVSYYDMTVRSMSVKVWMWGGWVG